MQISVIIPTYNSLKYISNCLDSVLSQAGSETEIIVIDNGSVDGTVELLNQKFTQVKLVLNSKNLGSAYARNQGIELSHGEYIVFLDSDAYLERDFFKKFFEILPSLSPSFGGVTPKIISQSSGKIFSMGLKITSIFRVFDLKNEKKFKNKFAVDGFNSCCAIIRKSCLEAAKENGEYFDSDFFFLFEDVDISLRIRNKGFCFICFPMLSVIHFGSGSGFPLDFRRYLCFRNRIYIILKHENSLWFVKFFFKSFFYDFFRTLHFALTNKYVFTAASAIIKKRIKIKNDLKLK